MRWHPKSNIGPPPAIAFFRNHARGWPGGGSNISKRLDERTDRLPDLTRRNQLAQPRDDRVVMAIVGDAQPDAAGPRRGEHAFALGRGQRHRLLAQNVFASLGGCHGLFGVQVDGSRDVDRIDIVISQEVAPVGVPALRAVARRELGRQIGAPSRDRRERAALRSAERRRHPLRGDVSAPDEPPADDHEVVSLTGGTTL